jgi:pyridoxine 5-phosphate synthase
MNLEGDTRDELIELALETRPDQVTLVPVTPGEITSDHGWDLPAQHDVIAPVIERLRRAGIRTSIFMDAATETMEAAKRTGTDRIEIYTEPYAASFGSDAFEQELVRVRACAQRATELGIGVNAGHDLDLWNTPVLAREAPEILEVSIGHALVADAVYLGLEETTRRYLMAVSGQRPEAPRTQ